jgi:hypothetical protein
VTYEEARYRAKHWGQAHGYYSFGGGHIFYGDWFKGKKRVVQGWANLYDMHRHTIESWRRARGLKNALGEPLRPSLSPITFIVNYEEGAEWNMYQQIHQLDRNGEHVHSTRIKDQKAYVIGIGWNGSYRAGSTRVIYDTWNERLRAFRQAIEDAAEIDHDEIIDWRLVYAHEARYVAKCYPDAINIY